MRPKNKAIGMGILLKTAGIAVIMLVAALFAQAFSVEFTPSEVPVCGPYPNLSMVTANLLNNENYTATNVSLLFTVSQPGLTSVSGGTYHLDSIGPGAYSGVLSWVFGCGGAPSGAYKVFLTMTSQEGTYSSEESGYSIVRVMGAPPQITNLYSVRKGSDTEIIALTDKDSICRLSSANVGYDSMADIMMGSGKNHTVLLNLGQGAYTYYTLCRDAAGNTMSVPGVLSFSVDSNPPTVIVNIGGGMFTSEDVNFNVTTNEPSICEMSMIYPGTSVVALQGAGLLHRASLSLDEGFYTWQVSCSDTDNNIGQAAFSFEVNLPPTADIEVEANRTRLGEGVYKIHVATSENVAAPPVLKLVIDSSRINIPLEGSKRDWSGYIILENIGRNVVGSFEIAMIDARGNLGTVIEFGNSLIIDTVPPPAPKDLSGKLASGRIGLEWYYSGEEIDHFNVYRSDEPYVGLASFRASSESKGFSDSINISSKEYYYAVSAVDIAGNEGPLSPEVRVEVTPEIKQEIEMGDGSLRVVYISNESLAKIEAALSEAGKHRFDLQSAKLGLTSEENALMEKLGIQEEIDTAIATIDSIEAELDLLRFSRLKDFEIDSRLEVYWKILEELESTPSRLTLTESIEYIQTPVVDKGWLLGNLPIDEEYQKAYSQKAEGYLSNPTIDKKITYARIEHLNRLIEEKTIILERLDTLPGDAIVLVIGESAPRFEVLDEKYTSLNRTLLELSERGLKEVSYVVNSTIEKEVASRFYALAIPDYKTISSDKSGTGSPTGNLIFGLENYGLTKAEVLVIIAGLIAIGVLLVYYLVFARGVKTSELAEYPSLKTLQQNAESELSELQKIVGKEPVAEEPNTKETDTKKSKEVEVSAGGEETTQEEITPPAEKEVKKAGVEAGADKQIDSNEENKVKPASIVPIRSNNSKGMDEPDAFGELITELELMLDSGNKEDATRNYSLLMGAYGSLSKEKKAKHYNRCIELHKRLVGDKK